MRGIDEVALAFDASCREAGVGYAFIGALAVMAWGEPRATQDADALVDAEPTDAETLRAALASRGLVIDPRDLIDAFVDESHVTIVAENSIFYVDAKLARTALEKRQVAEAGEIPFREGRLRVVRPEETIAFKLSFGSPKDVQDAKSILIRAKDKLDRSRLLAFAIELGVADRLKEVQTEIDFAGPEDP